MIRKDIVEHARQYDGWNLRQIQRAGPYLQSGRPTERTTARQEGSP